MTFVAPKASPGSTPEADNLRAMLDHPPEGTATTRLFAVFPSHALLGTVTGYAEAHQRLRCSSRRGICSLNTSRFGADVIGRGRSVARASSGAEAAAQEAVLLGESSGSSASPCGGLANLAWVTFRQGDAEKP